MAVYQAKMERKQGFLFRTVDIVMELFAMTAVISRARHMTDGRSPDAGSAVELANLFCQGSRRRVNRLFHDLWSNDDASKNAAAANVIAGQHAWLEEGRLNLGLTPESFQTKFLTQVRATEAAREPKVASAKP